MFFGHIHINVYLSDTPDLNGLCSDNRINILYFILLEMYLGIPPSLMGWEGYVGLTRQMNCREQGLYPHFVCSPAQPMLLTP